jgi:hypothetical protein
MVSFLLRDPDRRARLTLLSYGFVVAGVVLLCGAALRFAGYPWSFDADAVVTVAVISEPGPYFGVRHFIEVGGRRYACSDGRTRRPRARSEAVVYDRDNPARCRARAMVGRLGPYESVPLLAALSWLALGAPVLVRARTYAAAALETGNAPSPGAHSLALDLVFSAGLILQAICGALVIVFQ